MTVLTIFQHRASLESISCSEQQCFYCTSEFHKVYPLKLGNMLLQPNFLLLIQLLLTLLGIFDQLKQRLTFKRLITTSSLSTNLLLLQTCIQSSSLVESHDGCSHFLYGRGMAVQELRYSICKLARKQKFLYAMWQSKWDKFLKGSSPQLEDFTGLRD